MLLLAVESAGPPCSVALAEAEPRVCRIVAEAACTVPQACGDRLIALIAGLLEDAGRNWADIELIAVNRGPGSFTGARTAVAAGRALALATDRPVLPVTSFEALAASARPARAGSLMAVIDARRGQLYAQCFDPDLVPEAAPGIGTPAALAEDMTGVVHLVGSGADALYAASDRRPGVGVEAGRLDARAVAMAATRRLREGAAPGPGFELHPLYLRPPDARPAARPHLGAAIAPAGV